MTGSAGASRGRAARLAAARVRWRHSAPCGGSRNRISGRVMATPEPDARWPSMLRIRVVGKLSDMANLARAKDAAISMALRELNRGLLT